MPVVRVERRLAAIMAAIRTEVELFGESGAQARG